MYFRFFWREWRACKMAIPLFVFLVGGCKTYPEYDNNATITALPEIEALADEMPKPGCVFIQNAGESGGYRTGEAINLRSSSITWTKDEAIREAYRILNDNFNANQKDYVVEHARSLKNMKGADGWSVCLLQVYQGARFRNHPEREDGDAVASFSFHKTKAHAYINHFKVIAAHGPPRPVISKEKAIGIAEAKWSSSPTVGNSFRSESVLVYSPKADDARLRVPVWCIQRWISLRMEGKKDLADRLERIVIDAWTGKVVATGTNEVPVFNVRGE